MATHDICPGIFTTRTDGNERAAKECLEWLESAHSVAVRGLHYELMQIKGVNFICLLDMMMSTTKEVSDLKNEIKKLQMEKEVL